MVFIFSCWSRWNFYFFFFIFPRSISTRCLLRISVIQETENIYIQYGKFTLVLVHKLKYFFFHAPSYKIWKLNRRQSSFHIGWADSLERESSETFFPSSSSFIYSFSKYFDFYFVVPKLKFYSSNYQSL